MYSHPNPLAQPHGPAHASLPLVDLSYRSPGRWWRPLPYRMGANLQSQMKRHVAMDIRLIRLIDLSYQISSHRGVCTRHETHFFVRKHRHDSQDSNAFVVLLANEGKRPSRVFGSAFPACLVHVTR